LAVNVEDAAGYSSCTDDVCWLQACAPRYVYHSRNDDRRAPIGACYVSRSRANNTLVYNRYSPCRKGQFQRLYRRQYLDDARTKEGKGCPCCLEERRRDVLWHSLPDFVDKHTRNLIHPAYINPKSQP